MPGSSPDGVKFWRAVRSAVSWYSEMEAEEARDGEREEVGVFTFE